MVSRPTKLRPPRLTLRDLQDAPTAARDEGPSAEEILGDAYTNADEQTRRQFDLEIGTWLESMQRFRATADKAFARDGGVHLRQPRRLIRWWSEALARAIDDERKDAGLLGDATPSNDNDAPPAATIGEILAAASGVDQSGQPPTKKRRGRKPKWLKLLAGLPAHEIAQVVFEVTVAAIARGQAVKLANLAHQIGNALQLRAKFRLFAAENPALFKAYERAARQFAFTRRHFEKTLTHGFNKHVLGSLTGAEREQLRKQSAWTAEDRGVIGMALLERARVISGGRIQFEHDETSLQAWRRTGRTLKQEQLIVSFSDDTLEWIEDALAHDELRANTLAPMIAPPRPWTKPSDGGHYIQIGAAESCVMRSTAEGERNSRRDVLRLLWDDPKAGAPVFAALNFLGSVPLRINRDVLTLAKQARDSELSLPCLPRNVIREVPPKPYNFDDNDEARLQWKREARAVKNANARNLGKAVQGLLTLNEAERFADERHLWFPHAADFRGRLYPLPSRLNFQGNDLARALLEFADGKSLSHDNEAAVEWLASHVAKQFGAPSKLSRQARARWTHENEALIRRIATDPLEHRAEWEASADSKHLWQCYAACCEWAGYLDARRAGRPFITHLPISIDGSANGVQHLCALARDPDLARLVNLTANPNTDGPADLYREVANGIVPAVRQARERDGEDTAMKALWLQLFGRFTDGPRLDRELRGLAKRCVMTAPYGASHKVTLDACRELLDDVLDPHSVFVPEERQRRKAAGWLSKRVKETLSGRLREVEAIMDWLKAVVKIVCLSEGPWKQSLPTMGLWWRAPSGWPLVMSYGMTTVKRIKTSSGGANPTSSYVARESRTQLDHRKMANSVTANLIHSLDASHLVLLIEALRDEAPDINSLSTVHDAIFALSTDMPVVDRLVRESFARLYSEFDPLASFLEAAWAQSKTDLHDQLPELPLLGAFDVREVLSAPFFFH